MTQSFKGEEKRHYRRLCLSLPIMVLNRKVESKNISSTGVYFEVLPENIKLFQVGTRVEFEILAKTSSPMLPERTIRLGGSGEVIRNEIVGSCPEERKCGVALKFNKKLEILIN
ncbi:MAG: hypothetical protein MRK02_06710 [Candidatus Scalindua sp.]|nr:hypothetical protein [Candidatus Scalindua sp.]